MCAGRVASQAAHTARPVKHIACDALPGRIAWVHRVLQARRAGKHAGMHAGGRARWQGGSFVRLHSIGGKTWWWQPTAPRIPSPHRCCHVTAAPRQRPPMSVATRSAHRGRPCGLDGGRMGRRGKPWRGCEGQKAWLLQGKSGHVGRRNQCPLALPLVAHMGPRRLPTPARLGPRPSQHAPRERLPHALQPGAAALVPLVAGKHPYGVDEVHAEGPAHKQMVDLGVGGCGIGRGGAHLEPRGSRGASVCQRTEASARANPRADT
jgi:hypothetical protein